MQKGCASPFYNCYCIYGVVDVLSFNFHIFFTCKYALSISQWKILVISANCALTLEK